MFDYVMVMNSRLDGWLLRPLTDQAVWFLEMAGVIDHAEMYTAVTVPDSVISNARSAGLTIRGIV